MAHDRYVELERHPLGGFGFSVIGGVDTHLPPMVCALVHNGSAQLTGKVSVFISIFRFCLDSFNLRTLNREYQESIAQINYYIRSLHQSSYICVLENSRCLAPMSE